jgi:integrative and conjugative element protein (TIGR02256 family)
LKFINKETNLSITIEETLLHKLTAIGKKHYPNEFGGFLIGNYSDNSRCLNITDTILPSKYKASKSRFQRNSSGIEKELRAYYNENPKKYYIGEWHTHPDGQPIPSKTDIMAIETILQQKEASIQKPVLLIIAYSKKSVEAEFYVPHKNKLYKYETTKN